MNKIVEISFLLECPHRDKTTYTCGKKFFPSKCILGGLPAEMLFPRWCPLSDVEEED